MLPSQPCSSVINAQVQGSCDHSEEGAPTVAIGLLFVMQGEPRVLREG